ncbi:hypothetical protein [Hydrogenophaga sp. OTU3427]|uniref:hypothetical protein n=1 Tax=Hydrogenophaga sp. OTU3427 TaxID=3043856 RepID=UPI00313C28B3
MNLNLLFSSANARTAAFQAARGAADKTAGALASPRPGTSFRDQLASSTAQRCAQATASASPAPRSELAALLLSRAPASTARAAATPSTYVPANPGIAERAKQYGWTEDYTRAQDNRASIRALMVSQGQGNSCMVLGGGAMCNGADPAAYLPAMLTEAGIPVTQGILDQYQKVTGRAYQAGDLAPRAFDASSGQYSFDKAGAATA